MKMKAFLFFLLTFAFGAVKPAAADIVYSVNINTSSINNSLGALDFTFAGGIPTPPTGSVKIFDLVTDGFGPQFSGSAGVSLDNSPGYNDYFTPTIYGHSLAFKLSFSGQAVTNPNPNAGLSSFAFSLLDRDQNPVLVNSANNPGGFAFTIDLGGDGKGTVTNSMNTGTVRLVGAVPEPEEYAMMLAGVALVGFEIRRKQRRLGKNRSLYQG